MLKCALKLQTRHIHKLVGYCLLDKKKPSYSTPWKYDTDKHGPVFTDSFCVELDCSIHVLNLYSFNGMLLGKREREKEIRFLKNQAVPLAIPLWRFSTNRTHDSALSLVVPSVMCPS